MAYFHTYYFLPCICITTPCIDNLGKGRHHPHMHIFSALNKTRSPFRGCCTILLARILQYVNKSAPAFELQTTNPHGRRTWKSRFFPPIIYHLLYLFLITLDRHPVLPHPTYVCMYPPLVEINLQALKPTLARVYPPLPPQKNFQCSVFRVSNSAFDYG